MMEVPLDRLEISKHNVRKDIGDISELSASIKKHGILEPLLVRPKGSKYEVICGSRRFHAAQQVGTKIVPCIVNKRITDVNSFTASITENVQREDLTAEEISLSYYTYKNFEKDSTIANFADILGVSSTKVLNYINAYEGMLKLKQAGHNISIKTYAKGEERSEGVMPLTYVAKIEAAVSELEKNKTIGLKEGLMKRVELTEATKDLPTLDAWRIIKEFRNAPLKPIRQVKYEIIIAQQLKEILDDPETRSKLLADNQLVRQAHDKHMQEVVLKQVLNRPQVGFMHKSPEVGDKDNSDQNWHRVKQYIYVLLESLDLRSGRNSLENTKGEKMRERGWVSIFKRKDQSEIEEFLYDYLEVLTKEFKTIKGLGENELQQRRKDLR